MDAVENSGGAANRLAELGGIGGVHAHPFNAGTIGPASRAGQNTDFVSLVGELFGDGPTYGACSCDDVHGGRSSYVVAKARALLSKSRMIANFSKVKSAALVC
jgi:hypothetical protein